MDFSKILSSSVWNIPFLSYRNIIVIAATIVLTFVIQFIVAKILINGILKLTKKSKTEIDDLILKAIKRPLKWLVVIICLFIGYKILRIPEPDVSRLAVTLQNTRLESFNNGLAFISKIFISIIISFSTWLIFSFTSALAVFFEKRAKLTESKFDDAIIPFIRRAIKVTILVIGSLLVIQNLGFDVAGLVAGLGIGGLAVALAAKDAISNIFGSATVFVDKAFRISDWIKVGNVEGVVEDIGLRSTRIRKFSKTLVIIPNEKIANTPIENFSQRPYRRIMETLKLIHGTTPEQMRKILVGIRQQVLDNPDIKNDYFLVNFDGYSDTGLDIFIYCFTTSADWKFYLDVREEFLLKAMELIKQEGSDIARPVYVISKTNPEQIRED